MFPNLRTPTGLIVQVKNNAEGTKLGQWGSKNQHCEEKGVSSRKNSVRMMLFCPQEEEKTEKEVLG